jgi:hypothetical protein
VVAADGAIVHVNDAWASFGRENDANDAVIRGVGLSYLAACCTENGGRLHPASVGLNAVLSGELSTFSFEYPCHALSEKRWYLMTVTPYQSPGGQVVVSHVDISRRRQAENRNANSEHLLEESHNEI